MKLIEPCYYISHDPFSENMHLYHLYIYTVYKFSYIFYTCDYVIIIEHAKWYNYIILNIYSCSFVSVTSYFMVLIRFVLHSSVM